MDKKDVKKIGSLEDMPLLSVRLIHINIVCYPCKFPDSYFSAIQKSDFGFESEWLSKKSKVTKARKIPNYGHDMELPKETNCLQGY